jgi:hypothetical protein
MKSQRCYVRKGGLHEWLWYRYPTLVARAWTPHKRLATRFNSPESAEQEMRRQGVTDYGIF